MHAPDSSHAQPGLRYVHRLQSPCHWPHSQITDFHSSHIWGEEGAIPHYSCVMVLSFHYVIVRLCCFFWSKWVGGLATHYVMWCAKSLPLRNTEELWQEQLGWGSYCPGKCIASPCFHVFYDCVSVWEAEKSIKSHLFVWYRFNCCFRL